MTSNGINVLYLMLIEDRCL